VSMYADGIIKPIEGCWKIRGERERKSNRGS
jgi:hypothetical protein